MGSFMVYQALCDFLNITRDEDIKHLINPGSLSVNQKNLKDTLTVIIGSLEKNRLFETFA
jgi:erythronate-4-phosphate dehydrogenase